MPGGEREPHHRHRTAGRALGVGAAPVAAATKMIDFVTVLTTLGPLMTKRVSRGQDGRAVIRDYDNAAHFDFAIAPVQSLNELATALDSLTARQCVVLGRLIDDTRSRKVRRLLYPDAKTGEAATLEAAPHHWLPIDLDAVDCPEGLNPIAAPELAVEHVVTELLPREMRGADVYWQLTSGTGFKPGIRLRLVFWCDRKLAGAELKRWLSPCSGVDGSIYTANQPIYFARPIFEEIADPVTRRSGIVRGASRLVSPPEATPEPPRFGGDGTRGLTVGYESWCARIGDHDGGDGFHDPIKRAQASWIASNGADADLSWLRRDLERVIRAAPRDEAIHPDAYIETRVRDLDSMIDWTASRQVAEQANRKPELTIDNGDLTEAAREVGKLLKGTGRIFLRNRPVKIILPADAELPIAEAMTANKVVIDAHRLCQPVAWSDRKKKLIKTTLPERVAKLYLDMHDEWDLPALDGIAAAPLLAPDGSIRSTAGYDPATRLWCCQIPPVNIPARPTRDEAKAALLLLRRAFKTFPFADAVRFRDLTLGVDVVDLDKPIGRDESTALAMLETAACRSSLHLAPGFAVSAPEMSGAGTGKGMLIRAICAIAFGTKPHAFTGGHDSAELDKRIVAEAIKASPALFIDNVNASTLRSDTLASLMTERPASVRVLGESRMVELNSAAFVAVTGNGLVVSEDLARRFLNCELDAGIEDPEQRPFRPGFLDDVASHRRELLGAVLTIWRWGRQNALPRGKPLGSFETWCEWVRDPLLALGCPDPVERIQEAKARDPVRREIAELFELWWQRHGNAPIKASDLDFDIRKLLDPQERGRQFVSSRLEQLTGTRAADFVLTRQKGDGKWSIATYALETTVPRVIPERHATPPSGSLPYEDAPWWEGCDRPDY